MRQIEESEPVPAVADAEETARLKAERDPLSAELDQIKRKKTMLFEFSWGVFFLLVICLFLRARRLPHRSRGAAL